MNARFLERNEQAHVAYSTSSCPQELGQNETRVTPEALEANASLFRRRDASYEGLVSRSPRTPRPATSSADASSGPTGRYGAGHASPPTDARAARPTRVAAAVVLQPFTIDRAGPTGVRQVTDVRDRDTLMVRPPVTAPRHSSTPATWLRSPPKPCSTPRSTVTRLGRQQDHRSEPLPRSRPRQPRSSVAPSAPAARAVPADAMTGQYAQQQKMLHDPHRDP